MIESILVCIGVGLICFMLWGLFSPPPPNKPEHRASVLLNQKKGEDW